MAFLELAAIAWFFTWPGILLLVILGIVFEHVNWRAMSFLIVVISGVILYKIYSPPAMHTLYYALAYIPLGMVWATYRYHRHLKAFVERCKNGSWELFQVKAYDPLKMWPTITHWVVIWPFSLVEHSVSGLLDIISSTCKKILGGIYTKMYKSALKQIEDDIKGKKKDVVGIDGY